MITTDSAEGLRHLVSFRQWAKRRSIELVKEDKITEAKAVMDAYEDVASLEGKIASLSAGDETQKEAQRELDREDEEFGVNYPRFFVRRSCLVKQGENRQKSGIYEQRVNRSEFLRIVEVLRQISLRKREFDIREVLSEAPVPNYQAYLVLGALQDLGLIQVPRRGTYSFAEPKSFQAEAASIWQKFSA